MASSKVIKIQTEVIEDCETGQRTITIYREREEYHGKGECHTSPKKHREREKAQNETSTSR